MKKRIKNAISVIVLITIIALFFFYIYTHLSDFKQLKLVNPAYMLILLIIFLFFSYTNGLIIKYLLEPFGIKIKMKEWFGLSIITSFYNTMTPFRGGMIARAIYLKKKYNFTYASFLATLSGIYVINFLSASFIGIVSLLFIYFYYGIFNFLIFSIFLCFFFPLLFIVLFSPKFSKFNIRIIDGFIEILNGWYLIKSNRKIVFVSFLVIVLQLIVGAIGTMLSYGIFGISISFVESIFLSSVGILGIVVQITPSGFGVSEAISVFSAFIIGISPVQSLPVAILGRVIGLVVIFALGPIFSYILLKNSKIKNDKED